METSDLDGILTVSVLEARNLPKKKSAEYHIELAVGDPAEGEPSSDKYVKTASAGGVAPDWNQAFTFHINAQLKSLYGYLYRTKRATEKYIGRFVIDFDRMIEEQRISDKWFSVWDKSSTPQKQQKLGEIHLVLLFARNVSTENALGTGELVADKKAAVSKNSILPISDADLDGFHTIADKESEARFPTRKVAANSVAPAAEDAATQALKAASTVQGVSPLGSAGLAAAWKGDVPGTLFDVNAVRAVMRGDGAVSELPRKGGAGRGSRRPDTVAGVEETGAVASTMDRVPGLVLHNGEVTNSLAGDTPPADQNSATDQNEKQAQASDADEAGVAVRSTGNVVVDALVQHETSYLDIAKQEVERERQLYYERLAAPNQSIAAADAPATRSAPLPPDAAADAPGDDVSEVVLPGVFAPQEQPASGQHARGTTAQTRQLPREALSEPDLQRTSAPSSNDPQRRPVNVAAAATNAHTIASTGAPDTPGRGAGASENTETGRVRSHKTAVEAMLSSLQSLSDMYQDEVVKDQQRYYNSKPARIVFDTRPASTSPHNAHNSISQSGSHNDQLWSASGVCMPGMNVNTLSTSNHVAAQSHLQVSEGGQRCTSDMGNSDDCRLAKSSRKTSGSSAPDLSSLIDLPSTAAARTPHPSRGKIGDEVSAPRNDAWAQEAVADRGMHHGKTSNKGLLPQDVHQDDTDDTTAAASASPTHRNVTHSSRASSALDLHSADPNSHHQAPPARPPSLPPLSPSVPRSLRAGYGPVVSDLKTRQGRPTSPALLSSSPRSDGQSTAAHEGRDSRRNSLSSGVDVERLEQLKASFDAADESKSSSVSASGPGRPLDPDDMFQIAPEAHSPHQSESSQLEMSEIYRKAKRHHSPRVTSTPSPPLTAATSNKDATVKASWESTGPATAAV